MTNQMKTILKSSLIASILALIVGLVALFLNGFGYLYAISYVMLALTTLLVITLLIMYLNMKSNEREFKLQIAYYKLLKDLRDKAILDFYARFGLKPQYSKEGKLLTPDEFLGIITKLDSEGKLDPSVYEQLGILPVFDEKGREIPTILVLKHLIKKVKMEGLKELVNKKQLKGLYAKGTKKEKKVEAKKPAKATKKEQGGKKKGSKKAGLPGPYFLYFAEKEKEKSKGGGSKKQEEKKAPPKQAKKAKQETVEKIEIKPPVVERVVQRSKSQSDYIRRMYANQQRPAPEVINPQSTQQEKSGSEYGECTPE